MSALKLEVHGESWKLARPLIISRGAHYAGEIVMVSLSDGAHTGRGECCPLARYDQSVGGEIANIEAARAVIERGLDRAALQTQLPPGPARNALDCALWDLDAKRAGTTAWQLAGLSPVSTLKTAITVSLDTIETMAAQARGYAQWPLLKVKLGGRDGSDIARMQAVRAAAPDARLQVDVNEAWSFAELEAGAPQLAQLGVELIEQPMAAGADDELRNYRGPLPLVADESCIDLATLPDVVGKYQLINIKLDKCGGLTEAFKMMSEARKHDLGLMIGCMLGTSLGMAPAFMVGSHCRYVDLDAPLILAQDREPAMHCDRGRLQAFTPQLWG